MFEKCDSSNRQKLMVAFVLAQENTFFSMNMIYTIKNEKY